MNGYNLLARYNEGGADAQGFDIGDAVSVGFVEFLPTCGCTVVLSRYFGECFAALHDMRGLILWLSGRSGDEFTWTGVGGFSCDGAKKFCSTFSIAMVVIGLE